jgi:hypothetical protein
MYAVAFFAVASLVLGLWSEPTVAQPRATSSTLVKTDSGAVLGVAAGNGVLPHRGGRARRRFEYWNDLVSKAVRGIHFVQPRLRLNSHLLIVVARIGLVPKQCSTGGKERLGGISK